MLLRLLIVVTTLCAAFCYQTHLSPREKTTSLHATYADNVVSIKKVDVLQNGLKMRKLPTTDLLVSELCLGTMMFGDQTSSTDAFDILDAATKEYGINFIDTAEIYPAPYAQSTSGQSERILGDYMKMAKNRKDLVLSSKICGFSDDINWMRDGNEGTRVNKEQVFKAVDDILQRLGTDYLDILHINWPERYVPLYGAPTYDYECERKIEETVTIVDQISIMNDLIKAGKIRHYGLSNETPYGLTTFITTAKAMSLEGPVTIQNAYNLLNRNDFETGLLESVSPTNGNVGLLAYSPLAGGALTGKYKKSITKKGLVGEDGWRFSEYVGFQHRYIADPAIDALEAYMEVASQVSLPMGPLALAFVASRYFTTSTLIGVTSTHQLKENVQALNIPINDEIESLINQVYEKYRDPTKGVFEVYDPKSEYIDPTKLPWGAKDVDVDPELDILINERLAKF